MALEIERKFLVTGDYKSRAYSHSHIMQGYICRESGRTVRVRIRDGKGYLTIKGPSDTSGLGRYEFEREFFGENEGLVVAEIELEDENEEYERPDFIGEEVTGDKKYYNSNLMVHPYSKW